LQRNKTRILDLLTMSPMAPIASLSAHTDLPTNARSLWPLLRTFSWQEVLHHPWRSAAAVVAITLGVALAFAVHLINASALSEFSSAVRAVNGQPDLELRAASGNLDENIYARVAQHPSIDLASPVLEISTYALDSQGNKLPVKVLGLDALVAANMSPALMPVSMPVSGSVLSAVPAPEALSSGAPSAAPMPSDNQASGDARFAMFSANTTFVNAAARSLLIRAGNSAKPDAAATLSLVTGLRSAQVAVAGSVAAGGSALAVMDIAAAQDLFNLQGQISRIDLRLAPGSDKTALIKELALPAGVQAQAPGDAQQRIGNLSRAYRVNMTVLALVALFTGAFLVFSVLSLSVAKRAQQMALLGVLGLTARQRLQLVLAEAAALGVVGSALGIALGTALAALAMRLLGGDLGGGYFAGVAPSLQWGPVAALVYAALGVAAALVGAWWPARAAQRLPLAQTLKGLGAAAQRGKGVLIAGFFVAAGALLVWTPAVFGIPLGAYAAIGALLVGGIGLLPPLVALAYDRIAPYVATRALPMLAIERARRVRETAAVSVSGVVAALSLAVALTVMVASFRNSVMQWLDVVLPAPLYVRTATSSAAGQVLNFSSAQVQAIGKLPGVARVSGLRTVQLQLDPAQPSVMLVARPLDNPTVDLPMVGSTALPNASVPAGAVPIYVSEAMVDLYGAKLGAVFQSNMPIVQVFTAQAAIKSIAPSSYYVAGIWRDYARQFGAIAIDQTAYVRITGDDRVNDLAVWPADGADPRAVQTAISNYIGSQWAGPAESTPSTAGTERVDITKLVEFASAREIREMSLRIFDRSFAVTYWLQAVAIAIGLFGVAASFSAQVLARRKEFGLLAHLGLTRRQILQVVASEGAAWTAIGAVAGCALGLLVSGILVHVVNPQSFHWTMDLTVPWLRLALLCCAVIAAGTVTAWLAGRAAAGHDAVLAVKEDW
jgi:putative ABC transport system permease protein